MLSDRPLFVPSRKGTIELWDIIGLSKSPCYMVPKPRPPWFEKFLTHFYLLNQGEHSDVIGEAGAVAEIVAGHLWIARVVKWGVDCTTRPWRIDPDLATEIVSLEVRSPAFTLVPKAAFRAAPPTPTQY